MRKSVFLALIFLITVPALAQRKADYGISAGVTSYIGDINQERLIYKPGPACQFFYRYNFNPRQAVRINLLAGNVRGDDYDFDNLIQQTRGSSFNSIVGELGACYEFNFFPYSTQKGRKVDHTPYLSAGIALSEVNTEGLSFFPSIPFTIGYKINVYNNIGLEFEYGFRKTFYDNFDGLKDMIAPEDHTWTHNNDWYSYMGIGITWKLYNKLSGCPAINDTNNEKKRNKH